MHGDEAVTVVAAVIARDGKLLVCQRPLGKRHEGLWEFPGGKLEVGESMEDGARRELREELGVELEQLGRTVLEVADPGSPFVISFAEASVTGVPECREHLALRWETVSDLELLALAPSDRRFVQHLLATSWRPGRRGNASIPDS